MKAKRDYMVATPITMSVHRRGDSPHCDEAIHITVNEGHDGNPELTLTNYEHELVCTLEQLTVLSQAAAALVAHFVDNGEVRK